MTTKEDIQPLMVKVPQAAKLLSLSPRKVRLLFDDEILGGRWEGTHRMISMESIREYARGK